MLEKTAAKILQPNKKYMAKVLIDSANTAFIRIWVDDQ